MASFNHEKYLPEAIESALARFRFFELITIMMIELRLYAQNIGAGNINSTLIIASGEFVMV